MFIHNLAVQITLDMEIVLESASPNITSTIRTNSDLAAVEFKPVSSNPNQEYAVIFYTAGNNTGAPDLVMMSLTQFVVIKNWAWSYLINI